MMKIGINLIRLLFLAFLIISYKDFNDYETLKAKQQKSDFLVIEKECRDSRRNSFINIETPLGIKSVNIRRKPCFQIRTGKTFELYFNEDYSSFFELNNSAPRLSLYASSIALILALPWRRLKPKKKDTSPK